MSKRYDKCFDEDMKQLKRLPAAWIDMRGWRVGDEIEWLVHDAVLVPDANGEPRATFGGESEELYSWRDRQGMIGVVKEVRLGDRRGFPPQWLEEYECWSSERQGRLVVRFPGGVHFNAAGELQAICLYASDEGIIWKKVRS